MSKTHGLSKTPIYSTYMNIKARCSNKNVPEYRYYGGRGITICKEWKNNFMNFYNWAMANGYKKGLTIDRIDNNGNYEPYNCRLATMQEQNLNQNKRRDNKSGYVGICFHIGIKKWYARIKFNTKTIFSKHFDTLKEAIKGRNNFIRDNNLPHKIQQYKEKK